MQREPTTQITVKQDGDLVQPTITLTRSSDVKVQRPGSPMQMPSFPSKPAIYLSVTLIVAGLASIGFNITDLAIGLSSEWDRFSWGAVGHGIWTGTMCVSTGIVGIITAKRKTRNWVIGFLIDCIVAAGMTSAQFIVGMLGSTIPPGSNCYGYSGNCKALLTAMQGCLAGMAVVEGIAAVWAAVLCCKASSTVPDNQTGVSGAVDQPAGSSRAVHQVNVVPGFYSSSSKAIGAILITCGLCSWAFNIADLAVGLGNYYYYFTWGQVGHGLWAGIVCVATGAFGIVTARTKTKSHILSFNALCCVAATLSTGQFVVGVLGVADPPYIYWCAFSSPCTTVLTAMEACLLSMGVIQTAVAVWGIVISSKAYCCFCSRSSPQLVVLNQPPSQQREYNVYQVVIPASTHAQTIQVVMATPDNAPSTGPPAYDNAAYSLPVYDKVDF